MKPRQLPTARRAVLAGIAAGAGAAAAAIAGRRVAGAAAAAAPAAGAPPEPAASGYRETAHIRKYYRTTAI